MDFIKKNIVPIVGLVFVAINLMSKTLLPK